MTQGYFKDPENSEKLRGNGWLHTEDIGTIDEEYYLMISDRVKDVIKTGGEWVSSLAIEDLLSQSEGVGEVAIIGLPDVRWGERPQALIVLKPGFENMLTPELIKNKMQKDVESGKIKKWYVSDQIIFVTEIPKTSVGKWIRKRSERIGASRRNK